MPFAFPSEIAFTFAGIRTYSPGQQFFQGFRRAPFFPSWRRHDLLYGRGIDTVGGEARQVLSEREEPRLVRGPEAMCASEEGLEIGVFPEDPEPEHPRKQLVSRLESQQALPHVGRAGRPSSRVSYTSKPSLTASSRSY